MAHLLVAATQKSSGKTMLCTGLAAVLAHRKMSVQTFKKGPDYIDPMWLGAAAGRPCCNLDFHCMEQAEIVAAFCRRDRLADISLIEANKGLFDGVDVQGRDSNAALAALLGAPVVLVLDTLGMTRGIAPLVLGYLNFDAGVRIAGVVLNKVGGPRHESKLRAALEYYTDVPVLGAIGRDRRLEIPERHLGLIPANESGETDNIIARFRDIVAHHVDIEKLIAIAGATSGPKVAPAPPSTPRQVHPDVRIGTARDAAFGFYYPDDLDALARAGATLVPFDTLHDRSLPAVDGLFIGGGFPETQMAALEANGALRESISVAIANGMPAYAECGGMMYLAQRLTWNGKTSEMCGALPGHAVMHERPQGRGYVVLEETGAGPWPLQPRGAGIPARVPAHEFHYASLEELPEDSVFAYRVIRGHGIDGMNDGIVRDNLLASFSHQRDVVSNRWAARFVGFVRSQRQGVMGRIATT